MIQNLLYIIIHYTNSSVCPFCLKSILSFHQQRATNLQLLRTGDDQKTRRRLFLEVIISKGQKRNHKAHYKTKCYRLLVLCIVTSSSSSISISIELLSFGENFQIQVNKPHGLSQSQTCWHKQTKKKIEQTRSRDQMCKWAECKNIHSNMNISFNTVCWRENKTIIYILRCAITQRAFCSNSSMKSTTNS